MGYSYALENNENFTGSSTIAKVSHKRVLYHTLTMLWEKGW